MNHADRLHGQRSRTLRGWGAYLCGIGTATSIVVAMLLCGQHGIGGPFLLNRFAQWGIHLPVPGRVSLPGPILNELRALDAVVDGAGQSVQGSEHTTFLVHPDPRLGWMLRSDIRLSAFILHSPSALNLDPPVVYLRSDATPSPMLQRYLKTYTRQRYTCSTDADGFRTTVPHVRSPRKVLMVGDSVLFGIGVNDEATMASYLQQMVGPSLQVVNAGVGGYSGEQAADMAQQLTSHTHYDALIYIACQNDFMLKPGLSYSAQAQTVMRRFAALKASVHGNLIVLLHTYLEYVADDMLYAWPNRVIAKTERLRNDLPMIAREAGVAYVDWTDVVNEYKRQEGTIFAPFALYADHCHFSAAGNHLAAERLYGLLKVLSSSS